MKVSLNWVKFINDKYGCSANPAPKGVDDLVEKIGAQLGAVEEVISTGERYKDVIVVKVVECEKHPNADKLSLCLVDDGGVVKKVERNAQGLVQVVCGAPNVKAGMLAAWLPPGATVPNTYDKEPFVLEARELRGQVSNGMLASAKELALGDDHSGLLVIDQPAKPGQALTEIYDLDDHIIDIENKMFTHRPDLFGQLGVAREIAGIQHQVFKSPDWYRENTTIATDGRSNGLKLAVKNELPKLVPRFCAVALKDVKVGPSPVWLKVRLASVGVKSINNIVDMTNFYMLETAQPLHAYDYDKVKSGALGVRLSKKGENLELLGGKQIKLDQEAVVITDGSHPIGLGGVMGGAGTEVDENTKNIILECANFDMNLTRKTAMAYGLFTDAATRFTKGQSPRQNMAVLAKIVDDIQHIAGGRVASQVIDDNHADKPSKPIKLNIDFINERLGEKLTAAKVRQLLENVEFKVDAKANDISVTAPFWRTDIEIPEDLVEEAGRLYGYDKLPLTLPTKDLTPAKKDPQLELKSQIRDILSKAGANEVLTYSFVHGSLLEKVGQDPKNAYRIRNALSPDLQYYRLSLMPSLLEKVHPNIKAGFDQFALFEIGKGHFKGEVDSDGLPNELERVSLVFASKANAPGAPYFAAKKLADYLLSKLGIAGAKYQPITTKSSKTATYYETERAAEIKVDGKKIGRVGEFNDSVRSALKLPSFCSGFVFELDKLMTLASPPIYQPLNRYPEIDQDICLRAPSTVSYSELESFVLAQLDKASGEKGYQYLLKPLDIFQKDKEHKQTTWRIVLSHPERTLTTEEANKVLDEIATDAKKQLNAERI